MVRATDFCVTFARRSLHYVREVRLLSRYIHELGLGKRFGDMSKDKLKSRDNE